MERRRTSRRAPLPDEPISRIRLRTGRELAVVDLSSAGMLVEGRVRLLPGTHVDVHVTTRDGRVLVRSRVVRCHVAAVQADLVSYRGALAFERNVDVAVAGYPLPEPALAIMADEGSGYPALHEAGTGQIQERLSA
jgi:hypothetical protein